MVDLIGKKKRGEALGEEEIAFFVDGCTRGEIPDYQTAAFLMAVCFRGMSREERAILTEKMALSGETVDLSSLPRTADKHSTGGVGDLTTLVTAPIAAAAQESRQAIFFISFILLHPFVNFDLQLYHSPASLVGTDPELLPFPCGDRP